MPSSLNGVGDMFFEHCSGNNADGAIRVALYLLDCFFDCLRTANPPNHEFSSMEAENYNPDEPGNDLNLRYVERGLKIVNTRKVWLRSRLNRNPQENRR